MRGRAGEAAIQGGALEVTVVGAAPSAPQPDGQGSGLLIRSSSTALLVDIGPGVVPRLAAAMDPYRLSAIVVTHLHADHFLDLVSYRYGLPWLGVADGRVPVFVPPGGAAQLETLAAAISEGADFFTRALDVREYDPAAAIRVGDLVVSFVPTRHFVPAWGVSVAGVDGAPRIVISSDTGPNPELVAAADGADLLVVEATLGSAEEDAEPRGHLTAEEAVAMGRDARVRRVLLSHLPTARREALRAAYRRARPPVTVARPGLRLLVPVVGTNPERDDAAWRTGGTSRPSDGGSDAASDDDRPLALARP